MSTGDDLLRVDLNLLVLLRILLETQSVTRTAELCGMSQPAVSRALRKLRAIFDDPLLIKSGTIMRPTPRGSDLLAPLQKALAEMSGVLADRPAFDPSASDRQFRIATTDYGATVILPRLAALMTIEAPNASIDVVPVDGQTFRSLGEVNIDLALYSDNPVPPSLRARNLFQESFACIVRSTHPGLTRSDAASMGLDAYLAYPHALVAVPGGRPGPVDRALDAIGRTRHVAVRIPYFATAALLTASSDMILTIPRRAAEMFAADDRLQIVEPPLDLPEFGYRMLWHERIHSEPDHAWLRQLVIRAVSSDRS
ncbi:MAG: LysR family transcriptional regulator [Rhodomicrobiaceae bacterium]